MAESTLENPNYQHKTRYDQSTKTHNDRVRVMVGHLADRKMVELGSVIAKTLTRLNSKNCPAQRGKFRVPGKLLRVERTFWRIAHPYYTILLDSEGNLYLAKSFFDSHRKAPRTPTDLRAETLKDFDSLAMRKHMHDDIKEYGRMFDSVILHLDRFCPEPKMGTGLNRPDPSRRGRHHGSY